MLLTMRATFNILYPRVVKLFTLFYLQDMYYYINFFWDYFYGKHRHKREEIIYFSILLLWIVQSFELGFKAGWQFLCTHIWQLQGHLV